MIDPVAPASLALTSLDFAMSEAPDKTSDSPEAIKKAATQFESLLIGEVLKSARASDGSGWMDTDDDDAGSILSEVSEQQLSQALAAGGGLGLANTIANGLSKTASKMNAQTTAKGVKK